ncbi:MAG: DUF3617 domain-containing protein [Gammaproteobacteria bacterium]
MCSQTGLAQSVKIVPGLWKVTSTTVTPMSPSGLTNSTTDCMKDELFDPANQLGRQSDCEVLKSEAKGNELTWVMSCNTDMGKATGRGKFTSNGNTANGQIVMNVLFNGQDVEFNTQWQGQRLGDCG